MTRPMKLSMALLSLALAAAAVGGAVAARAQGPEMRAPLLEGLLPYLDLDLSDAQKTEVRTMLNDARTSLAPLAAEVGRARRALFAAATSPTYDEAAVRAAADAVGRAAGAVAVERARLQAQIRAILTAEQQAKLDEALRRLGERLDRRGRGPHRVWHGRAAPMTHTL